MSGSGVVALLPMRELLQRMSMLMLVLAGSLAHADTAVQGLRMWQAPDHTRFVFDLGADVRYSVSSMQNPERLVIDLDRSRLATSLQTLNLADTPVQRIRSGIQTDGSTLRIVFDLRRGVEPKSFLLGPSGDYGERLVLDLYDPAGQVVVADAPKESSPPPVEKKADVAATATAAASSQAASTVLTTPIPKTRDLLIAVDAGHGGEDPGAIGPRRIREKDVVLAIARELEKRINAQRGYRATMIRGGDYYVGLRQRRDLARSRGADLFVSVHADAFRHSAARGSSVYALSPRGATSTSAAFLAERENGADLIGGVNLGEKDDVLAGVLTDLSMTATLDASLSAGNQVLSSLGGISRLHKQQVEQAGFAVLKSPDVPSILVETGFISNPAEAQRLGTSSYQRSLAEAIFKGISAYFLSAPPPETWLAANAHSQAVPSEYVIAHGDTLSGIAQRYRVSVSDIVQVNGLGGRNHIRAGQKILIPQI